MIAAPPMSWNKLRIVHCGVDAKRFPVRRHIGKGRRLLFVGRLVPEKGCLMLLEAIAQLPDVVIDVVGDGPLLQVLRERAAELGAEARTVFHGFLDEEGIRQRLAEFDVFVMTSFAEGLPVVLMEALAAGVPAVATQIAGIPELIEDGVTGFLVPPSEPVATANAVRRLLDNADLRNQIAAAGREKVERDFDLETECERLAHIMTTALSSDIEPA